MRLSGPLSDHLFLRHTAGLKQVDLTAYRQ